MAAVLLSVYALPLTGPVFFAAHPARARRCRHLRRGNRTGYKAGALTAGIRQSEAGFFAVFDADFRPAPDILEVMISHFADSRVAVISTHDLLPRIGGAGPW